MGKPSCQTKDFHETQEQCYDMPTKDGKHFLRRIICVSALRAGRIRQAQLHPANITSTSFWAHALGIGQG